MKRLLRITFNSIVSLVCSALKVITFFGLFRWYLAHSRDYVSFDCFLLYLVHSDDFISFECFVSILRTGRITFHSNVSLVLSTG